jgi:hypothetical protein
MLILLAFSTHLKQSSFPANNLQNNSMRMCLSYLLESDGVLAEVETIPSLNL